MSGAYYTVLSIDGGGIRGIIPAMMLDALEQQAGKPICQLFDLIAGTSTGGILALGLACPNERGDGPKFTAADLVRLYEQNGKRIFTANWGGTRQIFDEKYTDAGLNEVLKEYFGDTPYRAALTAVITTAYDMERRRPVVFKTNTTTTTSTKSQQQADFLMRDMARATAAAPTYFEPARIPVPGTRDYLAMIDGGVFANNPALCAYVEAVKLKKKRQRVVVVSLGTGEMTHPLMFDETKDWGLLHWARQIVDIVIDGVDDNVNYLMGKLMDEQDKMYRLQVKLSEQTSALDNASPQNVKALKLLAEDLILTESQTIQRIANSLLAADLFQSQVVSGPSPIKPD